MLFLITLSGEIPLKSRISRNRMLRILVRNIRDALERNGYPEPRFRIVDAKILVEINGDALEILSRVFGIHKVSSVSKIVFRDLSELVEKIVPKYIDLVRDRKFAVRVKRTGKHSFTSMDVEREVGAKLKPYSAGVDLENPDIEVKLEIYGNEAYLIEKDLKGPGGLPLGSEGSALTLFSGGFDSPVAAWLTAKRGVYIDFLHLYMGSAGSTYNAFLVAKKLVEKWLFGYKPRFILIDFSEVVKSILEKIEHRYRQVVLRSLMYITAEKIASKMGYKAIVTGESIGQASSQTLRNLTAIEVATELHIPILRPLLGFDKEEIIGISRKLGLYELSSRVAEVCILARRGVVTSTKPTVIKELIAQFSNEISKAIDSVRIYDIISTDPSSIIESMVEIDFIPENSVLIDVRERNKFISDKLPGAIHISDVDSEMKSKLIDKNLVFYCDSGYLSSIVAKEFRKFGYRAFSISRNTALKCLRNRLSG
ncbi:MAG: tRNA uracil 4-sulfurtransferase ThiI [Desulfurococcaceae archaeon]